MIKHNRKGSIGKSALIVILIIITGITVGYFGAQFFGNWTSIMKSTNTSLSDIIGQNKNPFEGKDFVRILILGADNTGKPKKNEKPRNGLTDTVVLMTINTNTKEIRAISFPRDTKVSIPGHRTGKLNSAHVYGGPELTKEIIETDFIYPTKIDYYIKTDTDKFREMVDLLGGVYLVVEKDMKYTDRSQDLYINLKGSPEKQKLNGTQAEGYVRFRHDLYGDSSYTFEDGEKIAAGRIVRQQKFMIALCNRVISLKSKTERANFVKTCYEKGYIVSDLNLSDWNAFADFFTGIKPDEMLLEVLSGEPKTIDGTSYWVANSEEVTQMVNRDVLFVGENPNLGKTPISDPIDTSNTTEKNPEKEEKKSILNILKKDVPPKIAKTETPKKTGKAPSDMKITILNGSGIKGKAKELESKLFSMGYTNISSENAKSFDYTKTIIKTKDKNDINVDKIKKVVGNVTFETPNSSQTSDIVIIVGKDYANN